MRRNGQHVRANVGAIGVTPLRALCRIPPRSGPAPAVNYAGFFQLYVAAEARTGTPEAVRQADEVATQSERHT